MNAKQLFNLMCEQMMDEWSEVVIVNEIDANPEKMDFCTPECVGRLDAEEKLDCNPGRHGYRTILEAEAYVIGWKAVGELEDLLSGREDEDWHARGQW